MKMSKGYSQPEIAADIRLLNSVHGSGSTILIPGFDYDSVGFLGCMSHGSLAGFWGWMAHEQDALSNRQENNGS